MRKMIQLGNLKFGCLLLLLLISLKAYSKDPDTSIDPYAPTYRMSFQADLTHIQERYLKLPRDHVTADNIRNLKMALDELQTLIASIDLGNLKMTEITRPLTVLQSEIAHLPQKSVYTNQEVAQIRRWSEYLLKEPLLYTFVAKDDVMLGKRAFNDKKYDSAQHYFQDALSQIALIKGKEDPNLKVALSHIESQITIFYDASRHEQHLSDKRQNNVMGQIEDGFKTYHETEYNMWNNIPPWQWY